jgi:catechol 2,3-dioxygenase-like lactoylglutathione lyase family enzyme
MKRTWTIIGVADVPQSFKWYQSLFGLPETAPAHDDFGQIVDSDGTVLLCLHEWGAHEHLSLASPHHAKPGNGLLLFFRVDNFDAALPRARALVSRLEEEPHVNPNTGTTEFRSEILTDTMSPSVRSIRPNPSIEASGNEPRAIGVACTITTVLGLATNG